MPSPKSALFTATSAAMRARERWQEPATAAPRDGHAPGTVLPTGSDERMHGTQPDDQLVLLMQERDPHAFELVYERHAAAALGLARRMVREPGLAEDVTQEAFVSVWRGCANYRSERGSVRTWVLGITRHRAIDALRRRASQDRIRAAAEASTERPTAGETAESPALRDDEARSVRAAIVSLPESQRRTIELAFFAGLSQTEIAGALELPLGTVKGRMRLGLDKLRHALGPQRGAA